MEFPRTEKTLMARYCKRKSSEKNGLGEIEKYSEDARLGKLF
jgi:hypothetical protein